MPFRDEDFHDLVRLLEEHPEWRSELRRLVLIEELLSLPEEVTRFRAVTEQRFQELTGQLSTLTGQLSTLTDQLSTLTDHVATLTERVKDLAEVQKQMGGQVTELADTVRTLADGVGHLKGEALENRYRTKGLPHFSRILRRTHILSQDELRTIVEEALDKGALSDEQAADIYEADVVVQGKRKHDNTEVYLVVEVSWGVGPDDVSRAARRAALLALIGVTAIPVVAGTWVTPEAGSLARSNQTWQLTDGRVVSPDPLSS